VRPLIARLMASEAPVMHRMPVLSGFDYAKKAGRREYVRVSLITNGQDTVAAKYLQDGAGVLTSLTRTDGLLELPDNMTRLNIGDPVSFIPYAQLY
jgi:molybdopterin molybdotransferase